MAPTKESVSMYQLRFEPSGREVSCKEGQTLLDAAVRAGLNIPYGCRHGNCSACKAKVLEGDYTSMDRVSEFALMGFERDQGYVLLCSTLPESDLVVEIEEEDEEPGVRLFTVYDFSAVVVENEAMTQDIHRLRLRLEDPVDIPYAAGQFFEFEIPEIEDTRAYSVAAPHRPGEGLEFHVRRVPGGRGSGYMTALRPGDRVTGSGPYGKMQLRDRSKDLLFVAGGSGMAPIKSLLEELYSEPVDRQVWFFYGARTARDLYLVDQWRRWEEERAGFHFVPALSEPGPDEPWNGERGFIADVLARHFSRFDGMDAYLCGPPALIQTTLKVLYQGGLRSSNIYYDEF
ncbi:2Fe-2S iron-sulfur cluster binding domain-containing protein [Kyrpidia sp.]|uniref:NADH:ubiquinone reductase (Na(+)-transporting) subunit F n=1 Tax=Kyrpidia sp. TaxID=2073077 RepID=UPI002587B450|nr:2Fe-2S iron-sulfur cluster binding domain-containing protein [Kyrpidia sp.]MCL6576819.1 2Fe-2S iron-sulfur cluster binding domain-containing protein [Kyrpidia sp.]